MSGILFLLSIDRVMNRTTEGRRTGIRFKFTSVLKAIDFADDIALLSSRNVDIKDKTSGLVKESGQKKSKMSNVMGINARNDQGIRSKR